MSKRAVLAVVSAVALGVLPAFLSISCGGTADPELTVSPLSVTVGTHRATGSYSCRVPNGTVTFQASTYVYIVQSSVDAHHWKIQLNRDDAAAGVTLDNQQSAPTEAMDNGAVVYTTADTTTYVHRTPSIWGYEYGHDEDAPPYSTQFWPIDAGHPYGQLVVSMYPKGASNPVVGECAEVETAYLTLQP